MVLKIGGERKLSIEDWPVHTIFLLRDIGRSASLRPRRAVHKRAKIFPRRHIRAVAKAKPGHAENSILRLAALNPHRLAGMKVMIALRLFDEA